MSNKGVKFKENNLPSNKLINHEIILKNQQIEKLNQEKKKYMKIIYAMQSELYSIKNKISNNNKLESELKLFQNKNLNLEIEVSRLQKEILDLKEKYNEELRQKDNEHAEEIRKLKSEIDNIKAKVGMTNDITREKNGLFKAFNILLKEKNDLILEHDKILMQKEINTQMKLEKLKKKMIDNVKATQDKANELNVNYMDISSKLTLLQNHQFLIQLEYQEKEVENLVSKNEILEKKVSDLLKDIELHKQVEISLAEKNKKLIAEINKLKESDNKENEKEEEKTLSNRNNSMNIRTNKTIQLENKVLNLEKKLQLKQKEYMEIKDKSDSFEKILKNYEKKYTGLFKYFEDCLTKFYEDEELKNNKDIYINIESIKKGDFTNLNEKEKYSTLIILMKYLMPLIYSTESLSDFNTLNNINIKYYSKKKKIRISKENINNNLNQNIFKKMLNKKININPDLLSSNLKYNSYDDLPEIGKKPPLSPLLSGKKISINLKKF